MEKFKITKLGWEIKGARSVKNDLRIIAMTNALNNVLIFSIIIDSPSTNNEARIRHDLTCALAIRISSLQQLRSTGLLNSKGGLFSRLCITAPIFVRGSIILAIGLDCKDVSPVIIEVKSCIDKIPDNKRISVPELPASRSFFGFFSDLWWYKKNC